MPAKLKPLSPTESLWKMTASRSPEQVPIEAADDPDFTGYAIRDDFERGRMPIAQAYRPDTRYIEPIGYSTDQLVRSRSLGWYRAGPDARPGRIEDLAHEMMARAAGLEVLSPRDGDRVATWDFDDGGRRGRLIVLFLDGIEMAEERGYGDGRPYLMCSAEECLRARELRTTSKTREEAHSKGFAGRQANLFDAPRPSPASPTRER